MAESNRRSLRDRWHDFLAVPRTEERDVLSRELRTRQPKFTTAVAADARITAEGRGERSSFTSRLDTALQILRLAVVTDAFFAHCCYRAKVACQTKRIPLVPWFFHRLAIISAQVQIGETVIMQPGVCIPHGMVCVGGLTEVHAGVVLRPFISVGLKAGSFVGPVVCEGATIGTGSRVLGPVRIGVGAEVGANAVVLSDVPDGAIAVGVPARIIERGSTPDS